MKIYRFSCLFAVFLALMLLSSCVTSRKVNYFQEPDDIIPSYVDTLDYAEYTIRKHDRLFVQVYSVDEKMTALFNGGQNRQNIRQMVRGQSYGSNSDLYTYLVDDEGNIKFPTLGKVQVLGMTTREAKHMLEERLSKLVVQRSNTMLSLSVDVQIVQRYFSVIGVNSSGRFLIDKEKINIFEALAMSGDIADFGDRSRVQIVRQLGDSTLVKTFDVRSKDIVNSEFYYIEPNDVIYIRKMRGESFGLNNVSAVISVVASTLSFGVFVYTLVDRFIVRPIQNASSSSASTATSTSTSTSNSTSNP